MAKQKGIVKLTGTIGDVSFYKSQDGFLARLSLGGQFEWRPNLLFVASRFVFEAAWLFLFFSSAPHPPNMAGYVRILPR